MNSFISNFFPFTFCSLFLENLLFGCCIWGTIPPSSLIFSLLFFILWSFVLLSRKVSSWSTYASIGFLISAIMDSFFFFLIFMISFSFYMFFKNNPVCIVVYSFISLKMMMKMIIEDFLQLYCLFPQSHSLCKFVWILPSRLELFLRSLAIC